MKKTLNPLRSLAEPLTVLQVEARVYRSIRYFRA
jgi:hypothetical protein